MAPLGEVYPFSQIGLLQQCLPEMFTTLDVSSVSPPVECSSTLRADGQELKTSTSEPPAVDTGKLPDDAPTTRDPVHPITTSTTGPVKCTLQTDTSDVEELFDSLGIGKDTNPPKSVSLDPSTFPAYEGNLNTEAGYSEESKQDTGFAPFISF